MIKLQILRISILRVCWAVRKESYQVDLKSERVDDSEKNHPWIVLSLLLLFPGRPSFLKRHFKETFQTIILVRLLSFSRQCSLSLWYLKVVLGEIQAFWFILTWSVLCYIQQKRLYTVYFCQQKPANKFDASAI